MLTYSFRSLASKGFPSECSKSVCMATCTQNTPNLQCWFLKRRLTNTPRRHRLAGGQLSSLYPPSSSSSSFGPASVMMCSSARPAYSRTPLRSSVHCPSISLFVNLMFIQFVCDNLSVLIFSTMNRQTCLLLKKGWSSAARMPALVDSSSLALSHPRTPPPSQWPALATLSPLAKFQLVWRRFCEMLCCLVCLKCRRYKYRFALSIKIKLPIVFSDTVDTLTTTVAVWTRPSSTGSLAHIVRGACTGSNRCRNGRESGVRVQAWGKPLEGTKPCAQALTIHYDRNCKWCFIIISTPKYSLIFRTEWYGESYTLVRNFNPLTKASCNIPGTWSICTPTYISSLPQQLMLTKNVH